MTRAQALKLYDSKWWEGKTPSEIVMVQLFEPLLTMPFEKFHEAVEKALGRPVWTHEFAFIDGLRKEFLKERPAPTMDQILGLLDPAKTIVVVTP